MEDYVKFLDNLASALEISKKFYSDPCFPHYHRVLKRKISPLHQFYFDVVSKIIIP